MITPLAGTSNGTVPLLRTVTSPRSTKTPPTRVTVPDSSVAIPFVTEIIAGPFTAVYAADPTVRLLPAGTETEPLVRTAVPSTEEITV